VKERSTHHIQDTLKCARQIVVKMGSQVIVDDSGLLAIDRIAAYVKQVAHFHNTGHQMLVVSSGAVALGRQRLNFQARQMLTEDQRQACASVGQSLMINIYREFFKHYGIEVAQVLVNPSDFSDRQRFNRLNVLLETLVHMRVIPIINENDAIPDVQPDDEATSGNRLNSFGDNDKLAALVSAQMGADVLLVLSNVSGVFTANPFTEPNAALLQFIPDLKVFQTVETSGKTSFGRGGMASKLEACELASLSGTSVIIASGLVQHSITRVLEFQGENTDFPASFIVAQATGDTRFKRWIARSSGYSGVVVVNEGACKALLEKGASLLAVGVVDVLGDFYEGDVVSIQMADATDATQIKELARGIVQYNATELRLVKGLHSDELIKRFERTPADVEVIHRDRLVLTR
jgi:glutamate 5-kinase